MTSRAATQPHFINNDHHVEQYEGKTYSLQHWLWYVLSLAHLIRQKTLLSDTDYHDGRDSLCLLAVLKWMTLLTPNRFPQSLQAALQHVTQVNLLQLFWNCSFNIWYVLLAEPNTHIPISKVGRLRHSHYIKLHEDWSCTLMFSPFKHVGGILKVLSKAFSLPLPLLFFSWR